MTLAAAYEKVGALYNVHLKLTPPASGAYQGQFYTLIFDTSGSMGYDACKVGDDAVSYHTRMDMQKLVAELMATMLTDQDYLYLIGFSDNGYVLMPPTKMTASGKATAVAAIKRMAPAGCTNLWNSLELAHQEMSKPEYAETLKHAIMLTDGDESYPASHPQGTAGAFTDLKPNFALNVLGFGEAVSPDMLTKLCAVSGGRFSNVADFTTLATTSINALATSMATCAGNLPITVTYDDGTTSEHSTKLIQFGQDRNLVFVTQKKPVSVCTSQSAPISLTEGLSIEAKCRLELTSAIRRTVESGATIATPYATVYTRFMDSTVAAHVTEAAADGELSKAVANAETWKKWGSKYSWAYLQALQNDQRMNFKEQGQAHLGSDAFEGHKSRGDSIFSAIPKPHASGKSTTGPPNNGSPSYYSGGGYYGGAATGTAPAVRTVASVANTNNPANSGGCWAPGSMVRMADGKRKAIDQLLPGDRVWTESGDATVDYTLELGTSERYIQMCSVGDLLLTSFHPVKLQGEWVSPATIMPVMSVNMSKVYNVILSNGHVLDIEGVLTVSLGHELQEPIVKHDFFGSRAAMLDAIKNQPGFAERRVVFKDLVAVRSDGLITGWKEA